MGVVVGAGVLVELHTISRTSESLYFVVELQAGGTLGELEETARSSKPLGRRFHGTSEKLGS